MRIIKHLSDQILEEISGAEEYAKDALEYRVSDPELSKLYNELAKTEYMHIQKLHEQVLKKVEAAKKMGIEPPQEMLNSWDARHRQLIEQLGRVKTFIDMYK